MALIENWSAAQQRVWDKWVAGRPPEVRVLCERFPPNRLYLLRSSGHRVVPLSYSEDGTLSVAVSGQFNLVAFERKVFGVKPEDLTECNLPGPDEPVGVALTDEQADEFIKQERQRRFN